MLQLPSESDDSSSIESGSTTRSSSASPGLEANGHLSGSVSSSLNGCSLLLQDHPILITGSSPIQKLPQDLLLK